MNILAKILLLIASAGISSQVDQLGIPYEILPYNLKPYEGRQLPRDLMAEMYNKTDEELAYEDCMESYSLCRSSQQNKNYDARICAIDKKTSSKGSFKSICEMIYDNCKNSDGSWGYFHDGPCTVEFVEDTDIYTTPEPSPDPIPVLFTDINFDMNNDTTTDRSPITTLLPDEVPETMPDRYLMPETTSAKPKI